MTAACQIHEQAACLPYFKYNCSLRITLLMQIKYLCLSFFETEKQSNNLEKNKLVHYECITFRPVWSSSILNWNKDYIIQDCHQVAILSLELLQVKVTLIWEFTPFMLWDAFPQLNDSWVNLNMLKCHRSKLYCVMWEKKWVYINVIYCNRTLCPFVYTDKVRYLCSLITHNIDCDDVIIKLNNHWH